MENRTEFEILKDAMHNEGSVSPNKDEIPVFDNMIKKGFLGYDDDGYFITRKGIQYYDDFSHI